jgi:hypothetical protein
LPGKEKGEEDMKCVLCVVALGLLPGCRGERQEARKGTEKPEQGLEQRRIVRNLMYEADKLYSMVGSGAVSYHTWAQWDSYRAAMRELDELPADVGREICGAANIFSATVKWENVRWNSYVNGLCSSEEWETKANECMHAYGVLIGACDKAIQKLGLAPAKVEP